MAQLADFVRANNQFALELLQRLSSVEGNLFFAPYSIHSVLSTMYGAAGGETAAQLARVLNLPSSQEHEGLTIGALRRRLEEISESGGVHLHVANALWSQRGYPLLSEFVSWVTQSCGASISEVDYRDPEAAARRINSWVEANTARRIQNLVTPDSFDDLTRLVVTNAVYFKGYWDSQFDPARMSDAPFWFRPGDSVPVPTMVQKGQFKYAKIGVLQALELPYVGHELSMVLLLPTAIDGLESLEPSLTVDILNHLPPTGWRALFVRK